jgi:sec-independent protein translocase protein TatB
MFGDIGWAELLLIGIVALVVIGPEDLPDMFRQLGRFTAKLRQMSREFSRAMDQAAKDSGVKDVAKDLRAVTSPGLSKVKEAADRFEKWDPIKNAAKPSIARPLVPPPMPATPIAAAAAEPVVAKAPVVGPATQGLTDNEAVETAVSKATAATLKTTETPKAVAIAKPRAKPVQATESVAPKPRAPRKTKKAYEA